MRRSLASRLSLADAKLRGEYALSDEKAGALTLEWLSLALNEWSAKDIEARMRELGAPDSWIEAQRNGFLGSLFEETGG